MYLICINQAWGSAAPEGTVNTNQIHHILHVFLLIRIYIQWAIEHTHVQKKHPVLQMHLVLQIICSAVVSFDRPTQYNTIYFVLYVYQQSSPIASVTSTCITCTPVRNPLIFARTTVSFPNGFPQTWYCSLIEWLRQRKDRKALALLHGRKRDWGPVGWWADGIHS